ncbi:hypothetical protein FE64_15190, partial [Staphylococcus aureus]
NLIFLLGGNLDNRDLLLAAREQAGHARLQAAQEFILLQRIEADQDDDAVAEQDRHTIFIDAKRQRRRGQHVAALEAGRVD